MSISKYLTNHNLPKFEDEYNNACLHCSFVLNTQAGWYELSCQPNILTQSVRQSYLNLYKLCLLSYIFEYMPSFTIAIGSSTPFVKYRQCSYVSRNAHKLRHMKRLQPSTAALQNRKEPLEFHVIQITCLEFARHFCNIFHYVTEKVSQVQKIIRCHSME